MEGRRGISPRSTCGLEVKRHAARCRVYFKAVCSKHTIEFLAPLISSC